MRVIIAIGLLCLCACNSVKFKSNSQVLNQNAFTSNEPVPDGEEEQIPSYNVCSNRGTEAAGTNLLAASEGVSLAAYRVTSSSFSPSSNTLAAVFSTQSSKLREDLINEKKLKLNFNALSDGLYALILCDRKLSPDGSCTEQFKIASYKSKYFINVSGGKLLGGGDFRQAERASGIGALHVLYDINVRGSSSSDEPVPDGEEPCDDRASPLVIDLSGEGIELSKPLEGVIFDIRGVGVKERISWPRSSNNVFLVLDRNGNGRIDSVHEMFGNNTRGPDGRKAANGFEALRKYDLNRDNSIDSKDRAYSELRVWSDANFNGISERGELKSLASAEIESLSLDYVEKFEEDRYGNATIQRALTLMSDGTARMTVDIWFRPIPVR